MIKEFVKKFDKNRSTLRNDFRANRPSSYLDLVKRVVKILSDDEKYRSPDPERIEVIDHGDYQGTQVFVIGATGYQPSQYWYLRMSYGSCSHCDTFHSIMDEWYHEGEPSEETLSSLMTLALHVVQQIKEME